MEWRPYLRNRKIAEHPSGFVIIIPEGSPKATPMSCPICDHVFRSREDESAYAEFECCDRCMLLWAHPRRSLWKDGWRPTAEQVSQAEELRPPMSVMLDID